MRLGLRFVKGLRQAAGLSIEREQAIAPFRDTKDLRRRAGLREVDLEGLAHAGALASFGLSRRAALWQVYEIGKLPEPLFDELPPDPFSPLPEMTPFEETAADYVATTITTGPHLVAHLRQALTASGVLPTAALSGRSDGERVRTAGAVVVRQRPGTAKGFVFISLEDETGIVQAIVRPDLFRKSRSLIVSASGLIVEGCLQRRDGTLSVKAEKLEPLPFPEVAAGSESPTLASHDFR